MKISEYVRKIKTDKNPPKKKHKVIFNNEKIYSAKNYLISTREHSKDNLLIVFRFSSSSLKQLIFTTSSTPTSYSKT